MTSTIDTSALKALLQESLNDAGDAIVGPGGKTAYDLACEGIHEASRSNEEDIVTNVLVDTAKVGVDKPASWWLKLLNAFDDVSPLSQRSRMAIQSELLGNIPNDREAAAYVYRFLAYQSCPVPWAELSNVVGFPAVASAYPLIIADAYIWAGQTGLAKTLLRRSMAAESLCKDVIQSLIERWTRRLGTSPLSLQDLTTPSQPRVHDWRETIGQFGRDVGKKSRRYSQMQLLSNSTGLAAAHG